jgi:CRP/FNR family transcriptional regulator, cyclic AMP receptor protein
MSKTALRAIDLPDSSSAIGRRSLLDGFELFRLLDQDSYDHLASCALRRKFFAKDTICHLYAPANSAFGILTGTVKIILPSRQGKEIVLRRLAAGEIFGELALVGRSERSAEAVALTNCELIELQRRDVLPLLERDSRFCLRLLELVSERLRESTGQIAEISFLELPARLARALLRQAEWAGGPRPRKISIFQRELAVIAGSSRESVNRCLKDWERAGIVRLDDGWIWLIDLEELAHIAELS